MIRNKWKTLNVRDHAEHVMIDNINRMMKKAVEEGNFILFERLSERLDIIIQRYENGSIIVTLSISSIQSLDTLQSLYEGGVLSDVIHKDLLTDARMKSLRENCGENMQNIKFGVHIKPFDLNYCRIFLLRNIVHVLPNSSVESVAVYRLGSSGMTKEKYDEFSWSFTPSLRKSMDDSFVQERMTQVYDLLEHGGIGSFTHNYLELLYNELFVFINNHVCRASLMDMGNHMSKSVRFSGFLVNGYFQFQRTPSSQREDEIRLFALFPDDHILIPNDVWNKLLKEKVLLEREDNIVTFNSLLLQDFLIMPISKQNVESDVVLSDLSFIFSKEFSLNFFHLFTNFLYQFFDNQSIKSTTDFTSRDMFGFLHRTESRDLIYELVVLSTFVAKSKNLPRMALSNPMTLICHHIFPSGDVKFLSEGYSNQRKIALRAFLSFSSLQGFIESVEVYKGFTWQKGRSSLSFSGVPIIDLKEVMDLLHTGCCIGSVEVALQTGDEGPLIDCHITIHCDLKGNKTDSELLELQSGKLNILSPGRVSLNLSRVMLSPKEDVAVLLYNLPRLTELHSLNLTKTGLPGKTYIDVIRALRSTNIQELILNDNRLTDIGPLGLINIPQLHRFDLNVCKLGDDGLQKILSDFDAIPNLMELSISKNDITNNGLLYLYSALKHCKKLRALRIHENKLQEGCGMLISAIIQDHDYLEILNISELKFSSDDIKQITKAFQHRNITKINFRKCDLSQEYSERILKSMKICKYLQYLDFSHCSIGFKQTEQSDDEAIQMVIDIEQPDAGESVLHVLNASKTWDYLSLWNCHNSIVFQAPEGLYCLTELSHLCL